MALSIGQQVVNKATQGKAEVPHSAVRSGVIPKWQYAVTALLMVLCTAGVVASASGAFGNFGSMGGTAVGIGGGMGLIYGTILLRTLHRRSQLVNQRIEEEEQSQSLNRH